MRYAFIKEHHAYWPTMHMCRLLKVSRNGYYHWLKHGGRSIDTIFDVYIRQIYDTSFQTYGQRRIKHALLRQYGWIVSKRRIGEVMRRLGLNVKMKRRFKVVTTDSNHNYAIVPNYLAQEFKSFAPNTTYVSDITYIRTREGWLYLCTILDLYARAIIGWSVDTNMHTRLLLKAFSQIRHKRTTLNGAIFHSDRGSQYASDLFKRELAMHGMIQSMSSQGNCYDNAVAESFFHTLKTECLYHINLNTKEEAKVVIANYINFYNRTRLHSSNGYLPPMEKEMLWWQSQNRDVA